MSFAEKLGNKRNKKFRKSYLEFLDDFKSANRTPREKLVDVYDGIKNRLEQIVTEVPYCLDYELCLSSNIDDCHTLIDMLVEDGITNFDLTPSCELFRYAPVTFMNEHSRGMKDYYVIVQLPFSFNIFDITHAPIKAKPWSFADFTKPL